MELTRGELAAKYLFWILLEHELSLESAEVLLPLLQKFVAEKEWRLGLLEKVRKGRKKRFGTKK